jgi:hypothetical protein
MLSAMSRVKMPTMVTTIVLAMATLGDATQIGLFPLAKVRK